MFVAQERDPVPQLAGKSGQLSTLVSAMVLQAPAWHWGVAQWPGSSAAACGRAMFGSNSVQLYVSVKLTARVVQVDVPLQVWVLQPNVPSTV